MVVLSVSICNKKGKILLARQYVPMSRIRIEGLLSAFPKLINSDCRKHKEEYTFIEANNIRYLFQKMDNVYLLLLTNNQSNILQDFETLKTIKTITPTFCGGFGNKYLQSNKIIDLIPVLDEIISPMGYKQNINHEQIKEYIEMNSLSEKTYENIQEQKIEQQIKKMQIKAAQLEKERQQKPNINIINQKGNNQQIDTSLQQQTTHYTQSKDNTVKVDSSPMKVPGMILRPKNNDVLSVELKKLDEQQSHLFGFSDNEYKEESNNGIELLICEKLNVIFDRDGEIKKFQIKGELQVCVDDFNLNTRQIAIETNIEPSKKFNFGKFLWKLHPKMDSNKWKKGILSFKNSDNKFKNGLSKISILKWILNIKNEDYIPITFSFWPEIQSDNKIIICAKYIANIEIKNVEIKLPVNSIQNAKSIENGNFVFDKNNNQYKWILNNLNKDDEGTIECIADKIELENLYPISIHFQMENSYSNIDVKRVYHSNDDSNKYEYSINNTCVTQKYQIE